MLPLDCGNACATAHAFPELYNRQFAQCLVNRALSVPVCPMPGSLPSFPHPLLTPARWIAGLCAPSSRVRKGTASTYEPPSPAHAKNLEREYKRTVRIVREFNPGAQGNEVLPLEHHVSTLPPVSDPALPSPPPVSDFSLQPPPTAIDSSLPSRPHVALLSPPPLSDPALLSPPPSATDFVFSPLSLPNPPLLPRPMLLSPPPSATDLTFPLSNDTTWLPDQFLDFDSILLDQILSGHNP